MLALIAAAALTPWAVTDELFHFEARTEPSPPRLFILETVEGKRDLEEACAWLNDLNSCNKLRSLKGQPPKTIAVVEQSKKIDWNATGSRMAFDNSNALWDAPSGGESVVVIGGAGIKADNAPVNGATNGSALSSTAKPSTVKDDDEDKKKLRIVAISIDAISKLAKKELYKERKLGLEQAFELSDHTSISGAGFYSIKILAPQEVAADAVKQKVRDEATARGEKVTFLRTNTKAQLFGHASTSLPEGGLPVGFGLRLGGVVEIVETRAIPRDVKQVWEESDKRVFLWPLTVKNLKETLRVGEDITVTGRLDRGLGAGVNVGSRLGDWVFGGVGAGVNAGTGKASDDWISLKVSKIDEDHVKLLLQKGDGETLSFNVSATAGLDLYDDSFMPRNEPPSRLEDGVVGKAVLAGEKSILKKVEQLASAELSGSWSAGKHQVQSEGWASVSLTDEKQAKALDKFFHMKPKELRELGPSFTSEARDVTHNERFMARLSLLKITSSEGTAFYELRSRDGDGEVKSSVVGINRNSWRGDFTKTRRDDESVIWYDLASKEASVTVSLGPQSRLLTTTREKINDVIAAQKALGLPVAGEIDHPSPYLQFFGLGNYGRTVEQGQFALKPAGVKAVAKASRSELINAYLRSDWLFEKESYRPGYIWANHDKAPQWSDEAPVGGSLEKSLEFLGAHGSEAIRMRFDKAERDDFWLLEKEYRKYSPGRSLLADSQAYASAAAYANHVQDMQRSGEPEKLIELFLSLRKDSSVDLKRSVAATAYLSDNNFAATIEMTGKRVKLKPVGPDQALPKNPLTELNESLARYR
jgi:hypothetical protein